MNAAAPTMIDSFSGEYRFLSNFYPTELMLRSSPNVEPQFIVASAEHAFQLLKTINPLEQKYVAEATSPGQAKRRGQTVTLRPDWESRKIEAMTKVIAAKFANPELGAMLLATGDALLVEGNNWHDTFWGVCTCPQHAHDGANHLGKILAAQREILHRSR